MHKNQELTIQNGWLTGVCHKVSPHFSLREAKENLSLLVIHNISLPPGVFGGGYITDLFMGNLDKDADPYFESIYQLEVSAHCLIQRDGNIIQYVSFDDNAWHAGVSCYKGRERCNDYSIGIELEGTDELPYTEEQYQSLTAITLLLQQEFPDIKDNITGHCDIAPQRKTDPGPAFDWKKYHLLRSCS